MHLRGNFFARLDLEAKIILSPLDIIRLGHYWIILCSNEGKLLLEITANGRFGPQALQVLHQELVKEFSHNRNEDFGSK